MPSQFQLEKGLLKTVRLNDGVVMPLFGYGTYQMTDPKQTNRVIHHILHSGHRLLDTAQFYKNEEQIGNAVRSSGLPRKDVFVVSKVWITNMGREKCIQSVNESLKKLNLGYIDLMLMHAQCLEGKSVETYQALLEFKEKGLIRSVGVSNFDIQHVKGLMASGLPLPSVNQIELNAFFRQKKLVKFLQEKNIAIMGYSPLAKAAEAFENETLKRIANKHQKTVGQVMLRWSVQKGFITIPKSSKIERVDENADIFDFNLDEEDFQAIDTLPEETCIPEWNPQADPWLG